MHDNLFEGLSYPLPHYCEHNIPIAVQSNHVIKRKFMTWYRQYDYFARLAAMWFHMTKDRRWLNIVYRFDGVSIELEKVPAAGEPVWATYETEL